MMRLFVAAMAFAVAAPVAHAQNAAKAAPRATAELSGVVTGAHGPEAGVWVIAETTELPTKFAKIVVTDERGRYLIPELPKANYSVWVRGYGLIDSPKVKAAAGKTLNLKAVLAPNDAAAAEYYPAIHWYSMLKVPEKSEFPGKGLPNGLPERLTSQGQWLDMVKTNGCYACHQLGNKLTRTLPKGLGPFNTSVEAWTRRVLSGQAMTQMGDRLGKMDAQRAIALFAEWSDRIAAGELPKTRPERPQGVERNVVVTLWDWGRPDAYLHDQISTDKRNPTINANGLIYGSPEDSTDFVPMLDPVRHVASEVKHPVRDAKTPTSKNDPMLPSQFWGASPPWDSQTVNHNLMFDERGRVWFTPRVRHPDNPAFCRKGSEHPSAKLFPMDRSGRHVSMYDPQTKKFALISTCFPTHHLQFAEDANQTLWLSSGGGGNEVIGWVNRKRYEETGDEEKAQGWSAFVLDTNGNGRRDDYTEPGKPADPNKDQRIAVNIYGIAVNPDDGSVWGSAINYPGAIVRFAPGANPPATALSEIYRIPFPGYSPRGMDIDRDGVVWAPLASGHLASFDRRKCKGPLNGPAATGQHCAEGWTLTPFPGPQLTNVTDSGSAEASYYTWVDQFDTVGLGRNVPFATGNANESLMAFIDGRFIQFRVPYPLGFYAKGMDGRIDDPAAGWKGRGLWTTYGSRAPMHMEGGKGTLPKVVKFQLRPDPLAR